MNSNGDRITTFLLTFPRIVLAEFNTHRVFSRNSASSRAIPFKKMLELVQSDPFIPYRFQKDHKGMQGFEYFEGEDEQVCIAEWLAARDAAVERAVSMSGRGITKQLCNRLLEPFMYHKVIVTSTDYENFFSLRAHKDAEIHIAILADSMLKDYNKSNPNRLELGEWHIPFGDKMNYDRLQELILQEGVVEYLPDVADGDAFVDAQIAIASARCARLSYLNFEGRDDYGSDVKLYSGLEGPGHYSPLEHCGQANEGDQSGNFKGFTQFRKMLPNENRKDNRVIKRIYA